MDGGSSVFCVTSMQNYVFPLIKCPQPCTLCPPPSPGALYPDPCDFGREGRRCYRGWAQGRRGRPHRRWLPVAGRIQRGKLLNHVIHRDIFFKACIYCLRKAAVAFSATSPSNPVEIISARRQDRPHSRPQRPRCPHTTCSSSAPTCCPRGTWAPPASAAAALRIRPPEAQPNPSFQTCRPATEAEIVKRSLKRNSHSGQREREDMLTAKARAHIELQAARGVRGVLALRKRDQPLDRLRTFLLLAKRD